MTRTTAAAMALFALAAGCKKYPYVALLDGVWTGNANDASGNTYPMTNDFTYDEGEGKDQGLFAGTVDVGGYVFEVDGASSDKESAEMTLLNPLFPAGGSLKNVVVEDTTMTGDYAMPDLTYSGTFSLKLEE